MPLDREAKPLVWSLYPRLINLWVGNCLRSSTWLWECTVQLRGRWSTHTLNLRTFFAFCAKRKRVLKRVSQVRFWYCSFIHCYSGKSACFVLHCFWKQKVSVSKYRRWSTKSIFAYLNIQGAQRLPIQWNVETNCHDSKRISSNKFFKDFWMWIMNLMPTWDRDNFVLRIWNH